MENLLIQYIDQQFHSKNSYPLKEKGPVVTISREFGCPSIPIGRRLTEALNKVVPPGQKSGKSVWKFINKEIIEEAARELELKPIEFDYIMNSAEKGLIEDILVSFSKPYVNNHRIKHTIHRVVSRIAEPGYFVILGRGSAAILQGRARTLNVRLQASYAWRVEEVRRDKALSLTQAEHLVTELDQKRMALFELLLGRKFDLSLFDVMFNCQRLSNEEIVNSILSLMLEKKMV